MPKSLVVSSLAFSIIWVVIMWLWNWPHDLPGAVILIIAGAIAGLLWYWLFGMWARRVGRQ